MTFVKRALSERGNLDTFEQMRDALNREIVPLLKELRREVNRTNGNMVVTAVSYLATREDRHIVYDSPDPGTVTLPPAADVKEQPFTVYQVTLGGTVTIDANGTNYFPNPGESLTLLSDGVTYHQQ